MSRVSTARRGFTLIEVMIAVAIIGILASTAISMFQLQTQRTKRTEAMTNLEAMAKMQRAYFGENGSHPSVSPVPLGPPGEKQNWDPASSAAFGTLGFNIEGSVYYVYDVNSGSGICACPSNGCFTGAAYGDSDRDTGVAVVAYFHPDGTGAVCPVLMMPAVTAPIDPVDGLPIYDQPVDIFTFSGPIVDDY
jgi:prepilin-type N-terminal cleavage/methylation domain-containing protein